MTCEIVFELSGVCYAYPGGNRALEHVSFIVREGESLSVLGANASGKSTLLCLLDGLYFPGAGEIKAFGTVLTERSALTPPFSRQFRQRVGFLFQNSDAQLFCTTVEEELAFGPLQLRLPRAEVEERVATTMQMCRIEHLRGRSPQTLSGGEKKRVALASIITCGPKVILFDEPSAGLDPRTQQWLAEFMGVLQQNQVTLITASHDLSFIAEVSQRTLVLSEDHRIIYDGPTRDALADLDMLLSANLIHSHMHLHNGKVHAHPHLHDLWHEHNHRDISE
jgi:cobalt/nickel transport system ATP-binding protein